MGYNDRIQQEQDEPGEAASMIQQGIALIVRLVGLAVLLVGLWVGMKIILEAWSLYQSPERIERFAVAIERGSNLDKIFSVTVQRVSSDVVGAASDEPFSSDSVPPAAADAEDASPAPGLRLSYFAAWFIVMMLFLIIGSLAMSAITTGGRLALYDTEVKKFSREMAREFSRLKRAA